MHLGINVNSSGCMVVGNNAIYGSNLSNIIIIMYIYYTCE